jgi:spermidine/putrescine transport system substrate-binding protein
MDGNEREREIENLLRSGMAGGALTRRALLRRMGIGAGALSVSAFLAACGVGGSNGPSGGNGTPKADPLTTTEAQGELNFANWILYVDKPKEQSWYVPQGHSATIEDFEKETGTKVTYKEPIDDNASFFGTIQETLANGQDTGWDLIVVTDWLVAKMIGLGYLEQIQQDRLENFYAHAGEIYKNRTYDTGNKYSIPWQSGITGIGYNPKLTGREITSFEDLFDPAFKGKVGMFTEMRDTMNLTLLGLGVSPQEATSEDAQKAQQKLLEQRDAGIVRQYYGNTYADALARGDLALTMAWSGDVFILKGDNPELEFVVPEEGGILWTDCMAIPQNAQHPIDAMMMMDYVYDPENAAQLAGYVNYICPVPEAQEILDKAKGVPNSVANSPLIFPTPDMESRLHSYKNLSEEEEQEWNDLFDQVVQA